MSIAAKLTFLKRKSHLTIEDISQATGLPLGTINKIFSGQTRNPSLQSMVKLSNFFHVPIQYLINDDIPVDCSIQACGVENEILYLSEWEEKLFYRFRQLDTRGRETLEWLLNTLSPQCTSLSERRLICYLPVARGRHGAYLDGFRLRTLITPLTPLSQEADFIVPIYDHSLEPAYLPGTLLAIKCEEAHHDQLGVFIVNREGYVRKYHCHRGTRRLVALNLNAKNIPIEKSDEFSCLGVVLGAIRNYHWE